MTRTIIIHDMIEKVVKNETINMKNGINIFSLNLDDLNAGLNLFSLKTEVGIRVEKILKQ